MITQDEQHTDFRILAHFSSIHLSVVALYVALPLSTYVALPKIWYRRQMLGPISSYCAFVWQEV